MIKIENVSHQIGNQIILNNISLEIPKNSFTALIGPNGAGKSTLLSLMARLQPLKQGNINYDGKNLTTTSTIEIARKLAILTQENGILNRINVQNLLMFGRYPYHQGKPQQEDYFIVETALNEFQLKSFTHHYLTELSGGQRQRVMIAMVFCQSTDYILLDEPLNNLDMYHARSLMNLLKKLTKDHHRTIIAVLHDINQAAAHADHIIAMKSGHIKFTGTPQEVFTVNNIENLFEMNVEILDYNRKKLIIHHI